MSQEDLGFKAGLTQTYISQVEKGARNASIYAIHRIAVAMAVSVGSLAD